MSGTATTDGPSWPMITRVRAVGGAVLVLALAVFFGDLLSSWPLQVSESTTGPSETIWFTVGTALSFVGMATGGIFYLYSSGRGTSYIDISRPTRETAWYTLYGILGAILVMFLFNITISQLGLPVAESWVGNEIGSDFGMLLVFVVLVFFFNAPVEEFVFRNLVQKRLSEAFTTPSAIFITSLLFALIHLPGYLASASLYESVAPVAMIFLVSITFGVVYAYTEDLVVAAASHAVYNAVQLAFYIPQVL